MKSLLLALDVDGVLRDKNRPHDGRLDAAPMRAFERLRNHFDLTIVVTSTWKDLYSVAELRELVAPEIAGATETLAPANELLYPRQHEVERYIAQSGCELEWFAIDDDCMAYPSEPNIFFTNPREGLTEAVVDKIIAHYSVQGNLKMNKSHSLDHLVVRDPATGTSDYKHVSKALADTLGIPYETLGKLVSGTLVGDPRVLIRNLIEGAIASDEAGSGRVIQFDEEDFKSS